MRDAMVWLRAFDVMRHNMLEPHMRHHPRAYKRTMACVLLFLSACTTAPQAPTPSTPPAPNAAAGSAPFQPEMATGWQSKTDVLTQRYAVAAANPLATQAGLAMLKAGGSAVDAAIAVQMV